MNPPKGLKPYLNLRHCDKVLYVVSSYVDWWWHYFVVCSLYCTLLQIWSDIYSWSSHIHLIVSNSAVWSPWQRLSSLWDLWLFWRRGDGLELSGWGIWRKSYMLSPPLLSWFKISWLNDLWFFEVLYMEVTDKLIFLFRRLSNYWVFFY